MDSPRSPHKGPIAKLHDDRGEVSMPFEIRMTFGPITPELFKILTGLDEMPEPGPVPPASRATFAGRCAEWTCEKPFAPGDLIRPGGYGVGWECAEHAD